MSCECNATLNNTGKLGCEPLMKVAKHIIVVPKFNDEGELNSITTTDNLNQSFFDDLINDSDASKRWFPVKDIKNISSEKSDSVFQEFEDGSKIFIREGVRSFAGTIAKGTPKYLGKLKDKRCVEFGVYIVDKDGNLIGSTHGEADKLYPIVVDNSSWDARYVVPTDSTVSSILLAFDFSVDEKDEELAMVTSADIAPVNLLSLSGLIDVNMAYVSQITNTSFTAKLTTDFGSVVNPIVVKGLLAANFTLYNKTGSASVTITTVTEATDGVYTFTFASQPSGNILTLSGNKNGYDFTRLATENITLPSA